MRKITQSIGAGETIYLPMCKSFMLIDTADYDCSFYFYGKNNQLNKEIVGFRDIFTVNAGENNFFMKIGVYSASAQSIEVVLLDDDRVLYNKMSGEVSVNNAVGSPVNVNLVNGFAKEYDSLTETCFMACGYCPAAAANYSTVHLYNPSSTKNLFLNQIEFISENSCNIRSVVSAGSIGADIGYGANCFLGKTASAGNIRYEQTGTMISDIKGCWSSSLGSNNNRGFDTLIFSRPLIIPPSYRIGFQSDVLFSFLKCTFHWREEDV